MIRHVTRVDVHVAAAHMLCRDLGKRGWSAGYQCDSQRVKVAHMWTDAPEAVISILISRVGYQYLDDDK